MMRAETTAAPQPLKLPSCTEPQTQRISRSARMHPLARISHNFAAAFSVRAAHTRSEGVE